MNIFTTNTPKTENTGTGQKTGVKCPIYRLVINGICKNNLIQDF